MPATKILMAGNCVLDEVWTLDHFPAEDEEMRARQRRRKLGGNACNSAQILAQLGNAVELTSTLADDESAAWMLGELTRLGISTQYCRQIGAAYSPKSVIWLNRQNGSRTIVHHRDLAELSAEDLTVLSNGDLHWVHLEGRNVETLLDVLSARSISCPVSLEIEKARPDIERLLPFVNTVIVSKAYLAERGINAHQCIEEFSALNPALEVVCTLGADGVAAASHNTACFELPAQPVSEVVDSIGAGDCFIAGFIHQRLQSNDFRAAVAYANRLAANKIGHWGMKIDV